MARRTSSSPRRTSKPQWMAILTLGVTVVNAIVRLFGLFRKKNPASRTTSRSDDRGSVPDMPTPRSSPKPERPSREKPPASPSSKGADGGIGQLFKERRGDVVVEAGGTVVKILPDDLDTSDGSERHQKFLVELPAQRSGDTVTIRISHNLKFGRVPLEEGDAVRFKGEYEWTELGGTLHWTHHDPRGIHEDGFIEHNGKRYE